METLVLTAQRWLFTEKQNARLESFDLHDELAPSQILVKTLFSAVSPGTECANYLALDPDVHRPGAWCCYPWRPGYAGVGQVLRVGSHVHDYQVGDVVHGLIPHVSHHVMDTLEPVVKVPAGLPLEQAAYAKIVGIGMTAQQVLHNDTLPIAAVWGLGMIGNFAAQSLQRSGAHVIGIDPLAQRRELAHTCGIRDTLDPQSAHFAARLSAYSDDQGLDIAVDATGHAPTVIGIFKHLRMGGQFVLLTHWRSQPDINGSEMIGQILWKCIHFHGAHEAYAERELGGNDRWVHIQRRKWSRIMQEMLAGQIKVAPMLSHLVKPQQVREVYQGLCFDKAHWWGVAVDWR